MRKTTISVLLTILLAVTALFWANNIYAQGQYTCEGTSGLCVARNLSCLTGWRPNPAGCPSPGNPICGGTFSCIAAPGFGDKNQPCREGPAGTQCNNGMVCQGNICTDQNPASSQGGSGSDIDVSGSCGGGFVDSAIGCIPFGSTTDLAAFFLRWGIGIGGGIAFLLIIVASYIIMTSSGDPKRLQSGRELLTSAIAGLLMLIFSIFILRILGVNILKIF